MWDLYLKNVRKRHNVCPPLYLYTEQIIFQKVQTDVETEAETETETEIILPKYISSRDKDRDRKRKRDRRDILDP